MALERPSVFLVAGNRLLRESLAKLLTRRGDFNVCGVSAWIKEFSSSLSAANPDVLVLDSFTIRFSNCAIVSEVIHENASIKVVLIDMDEDPAIFLECVKTGAVGYILREASAREVLAGIHAVAQGKAICPPQLCRHLFKAFSRQWTAVPSARIRLELGLTRRQQQIVPLIAQGLTNKEIALNLNISEQTVKNHVHDIMRRVGVSDRLQVIDMTHISDTLRG